MAVTHLRKLDCVQCQCPPPSRQGQAARIHNLKLTYLLTMVLWNSDQVHRNASTVYPVIFGVVNPFRHILRDSIYEN